MVADDLSEPLRSLNQARKDANYAGDDPGFGEGELKALFERIETIVVIAQEAEL